MKKVLMAAAAVACFGTVAMAGPNAGGTLVLTTNGTVYTSDVPSYCGASGIDRCEDGVASADGVQNAAQAIVLHAVAAFAPSANPRLSGITFGVAYDDTQVFLNGAGGCGDFELPTSDQWPGSGEGTAITWNAAQTGQVIDIYWFAGYNYYGNPNTFDLTPHPTQGAFFADDSIPAEVDPIAALGSFGFDTAGNLPCPDPGNVQGACCADDGSCEITAEADCAGTYQGDGTSCDPNPCPQPATGACCASDLSCSIRTEAECADLGGIYLGDDTVCDPNPCPNPVIESSWGEIKNTYR